MTDLRSVGRLAASAVLSLATITPLAAPALAGAPAAPERPSAAPGAKPQQAPARPNIVFVLADDLGWSDLSTGRTNAGHPSDFNQTPAIARLAREGVSFDNAYACLNCAPTRAALMSGVYAQRKRNGIYAVDSLDRGGDDTLLLGPAQGDATGDDALRPSTVTVAETLQRAGYDTGYTGKFHVTRDVDDITAVHGWDESFGGTQSANATDYHATDGAFNNSVAPSLDAFAGDYTQDYVDANIAPYSHGVSQAQLDALVGTDKHVSDAVGDATLDFIDRHKDRPFFTWMSEYAVHAPIADAQARDDLLAKYQAKTPGQSPAVPSYAALAEGLDQTVARLVDHLETTPDPRNPGHPLADNTLVVFSSDNGGRTDYGADNGPLKGQKAELDEGGVRVPFIAWSANPDLVDGRRVESSVINSTDLYPTLAEFGRAQLPQGQVFDGSSLEPLIARDGSVDRPRFWHMPGYVVKEGQDQRPQSSVRDGSWKLLYSYETLDWELYDLRTDIGERRNRAAARPDVVRRLGQELITWLDRTNAPLATIRPGKPDITVRVRGQAYRNDEIRKYGDKRLTIKAGQEVPLVLARP